MVTPLGLVYIMMSSLHSQPVVQQYYDNMPSMIVLDKVSSLLVKALGNEWGRIHSYCYHQDDQFNVAISNIRREFQDHPHMQILMTLKQWTRATSCTCQLLYDKINPLVAQYPHGLSKLRILLFNRYHDG